MNCEEFGLLMAGRETGATKAEEIAAHLETCAECHANVGYLRWLGGELAGLPTALAPAGVSAAVLREVGRERRRTGQESKEIGFSAFQLPDGPLLVAYGERGILRTGFGMAEADFATLLAGEGYRARRDEHAPREVASAVSSFVRDGHCRPEVFDLTALGAFERAVLTKALEIPRREVRSYGWIAREIGHAGASRAVGNALGRNPIPLLIPCHRALRGDGTIGGYALGPEVKRRLLAAEGVDLGAVERDAHQGVRFHASRTTGIFCLPTCRHARRIEAKNRVSLRTEAEARAAGYRPCRVCRPVADAPVA